MQDYSTFGISDELRKYIEAVVMEVFLEGQSFEKYKKYLRRFCEAEGINYGSFESGLSELFDCLEKCKKQHSKSGECLARLLARDCYITDEVMEKLFSKSSPAPSNAVNSTFPTMEFVDHHLLMRNGKLQEAVENGRAITPCAWKYADSYHEGMACVEEASGMGYIDTAGNAIISCQWKSAGHFSEGLAMVENKKHEYFFIDKSGEVVITCAPGINPFQRRGGFHEGLAVVKDEKNNKYGFIDKSGRIAIPCKWNDAIDFQDGLAAVEGENEKWGCIDKNGRLALPCLYDTDIIFCEGIANVTTDDYRNNFCIDRTGRKLFDWNQDSNTICFQEGLASIEEWGFIDKTGTCVIEDKWSPEWLGFSEGLAPTEEGYIDHSGQVVIKGDWEDVHEFKEGMAMVFKDDKFGYIDRHGRLAIPFIWDYAHDFSEGMAHVQLDGKFYIINKQGKVLCKIKRT